MRRSRKENSVASSEHVTCNIFGDGNVEKCIILFVRSGIMLHWSDVALTSARDCKLILSDEWH